MRKKIRKKEAEREKENKRRREGREEGDMSGRKVIQEKGASRTGNFQGEERNKRV